MRPERLFDRLSIMKFKYLDAYVLQREQNVITNYLKLIRLYETSYMLMFLLKILNENRNVCLIYNWISTNNSLLLAQTFARLKVTS